jgi:ribosome-associated translation inhibitor RaiA
MTKMGGGRGRSEESPEKELLTLTTAGNVSEYDVQYATRHIGSVIRKVKERVLLARVKLTVANDPARSRPAIAQALIDVNGDLVRARAAAETMPVAIQLLSDRLDDKLEHRAQHRQRLHKSPGVSGPGEWRHGSQPSASPGYYDRPMEERRLVRRRAFATEAITPDEAVFEMRELDYDFYLFVDVGTGEDAVIERQPDGSSRLMRLRPPAAEPGILAEAITVSEYEAPLLTVEEAIERLGAIGQNFLFFADKATGRGNLVYKRYDGHYGLITPT